MPVAKDPDLAAVLVPLRRRLERAFRPDTAAQGFSGTAPSTGHCAAVATIIHATLGGELLSTILHGQSHWFNRLQATDGAYDVDLTGDQFSLAPLQIQPAGQLYEATRVRHADELNSETLRRAHLLARRAELIEAERSLETRAHSRTPAERR